MTKRLIIMRGISGSGKTTYAHKNYPDAVFCSADDFYVDPLSGVYDFDPAKLGEAHLYSWRKAHEAMMSGAPLVVIDNTHTQLWEMSPYIQMGAALGYDVLIVRMDTPVTVAATRNVHGVPEKAVRGMQDRFQKVLPFWKEIVVSGV